MGDEFDDYLADFEPQDARVTLCMNGRIAAELERLGGELEEARKYDEAHNEDDRAPAIAARILELEQQAEGSTREFVFEGIGDFRWGKLRQTHPPTKDLLDLGIRWGEGFSAAAIQASCVKPRMTAEQVARLQATVNAGQWMKLFATCLRANTEDESGPKSELASKLIHGSEARPSAPLTTAFPEVSS